MTTMSKRTLVSVALFALSFGACGGEEAGPAVPGLAQGKADNGYYQNHGATGLRAAETDFFLCGEYDGGDHQGEISVRLVGQFPQLGQCLQGTDAMSVAVTYAAVTLTGQEKSAGHRPFGLILDTTSFGGPDDLAPDQQVGAACLTGSHSSSSAGLRVVYRATGGVRLVPGGQGEWANDGSPVDVGWYMALGADGGTIHYRMPEWSSTGATKSLTVLPGYTLGYEPCAARGGKAAL